MRTGSTSWIKGPGFLENSRLLEGMVDFVELLVYTWDDDICHRLFREMVPLMDLDLDYTVHLPTDSAENAYRAMMFFEDSRFPILNHVLHPLPGWRAYPWNGNVSVENLIDIVEPYHRMVFDVGHHMTGLNFPDGLASRIVEVHLMGAGAGTDHCPLDTEAMKTALPYLSNGMLVNFEVFDMDGLKESLRVFREYVK